MQTCNFTQNRQLRKSDAVCASVPTNQCTIAPRLNLLKIDSEQSLSPKSDGKTCATSDSKETARPSKFVSSGKKRLAFLVLAAALNGCVPDSILLSETDASAEVSQLDAADEDSEVPDVKKPRKDASLDEEEVDASLDVADEDASVMDADASDVTSEDVSQEETEVPDRVPPRDSPDADVEDVVSEDVPNDRVTPPRDSPDADVEDVVSEDVPTDRVVPPMDVLDVLDASEDRVVPPMDTPRDIVSETSLPDVTPDSPTDVRDATSDATRYCPLTSFSSYLDLNALPILACTPNSDGSSNSACPNAPRTFAGLGLFATDTNGSRDAFDVSIYCMEGGRATMRLGAVLLRTSETATFCISTAPDRGVSYTISGIRHLTSPPGRDGLGAIDGQIRAVDSTAPTCRTSVP